MTISPKKRIKKGTKWLLIMLLFYLSAGLISLYNWIKVQFANYAIVEMYRNGASQEAMIQKYRQLLRYRYIMTWHKTISDCKYAFIVSLS